MAEQWYVIAPWEDKMAAISEDAGGASGALAYVGREDRDKMADARLIAQSPRLLTSLEALIKGIDEWNEAVQQVIGRYPDYEWGELEEARRIVAEARGEEER